MAARADVYVGVVRLPRLREVAYDVADLRATIEHLPSDILMTQPRPLRLFISYAHEDDPFRRELEIHLSSLKRQGFVEIWSDRALEAGQEWEQSISQQLKTADIILLLISPDFLASEYIYENELTRAIERHEAGEARVIPVFLRPCDWKDEVFSKLQGVPDNAKPISRWEDRDEAFQAVARAIRKAAGSLTPGGLVLVPPLPPASVGPVPLPAKPYCIGREAIVKKLVRHLLAAAPRPITMLGSPGIGKTTVCLAALHDDRVHAKYGAQRYFVRLDSATTAESLIIEMAKALAVPLGTDRLTAVLAALAQASGVLALDNVETPWQADLVATEEMLARLASVPGLALVLTLRGQQRPGGLHWEEPITVPPLAPTPSRRLFLEKAGHGFAKDRTLNVLITAMDGVPLALELMAHVAEGTSSLAGVWRRWQTERTEMLQRGPADSRLLNLAVSLELSIRSPRMTGDGRRLLSLMGWLPDGLAETDLEILLPGCGDRAATILRQTALGFGEEDRLRLLAPVREHVQVHHPPEDGDFRRVVDHFMAMAHLAEQVGWEGGGAAVRRPLANAANVESILNASLTLNESIPAIEAAIAFARFQWTTGVGGTSLLVAAAAIAEKLNEMALKAKCIEGLGGIALERSGHDGARAHFQEALLLYQQVGDVLGQANCIKGLGDIALARSDYDGARARFEEAMPLYQQIGDARGQANCIFRLGEIALARADHDGARACFEKALPLYQQIGNKVLGQANCIFRLGEIALARADHDGARAHFQEALPLYQQVGDVLGQANCIFRLGEIALERANHNSARACFEKALPLYQQVGNVLGQANCIFRFGKIALAYSDHDGARARLREALLLYERFGSPEGIGWVHCTLAQVATTEEERQEHIQAARMAWTSIQRVDLIRKWLDQ